MTEWSALGWWAWSTTVVAGAADIFRRRAGVDGRQGEEELLLERAGSLKCAAAHLAASAVGAAEPAVLQVSVVRPAAWRRRRSRAVDGAGRLTPVGRLWWVRIAPIGRPWMAGE